MKNPDYKEVANNIFKEKYPEANALFLAGSVVRGDHSKYSDLDIIVIYDQLETARRESFTFEGWPIEAFIHTKETLNYFYKEMNLPCGEPSLSQMISESIVIPKNTPLSDSIKQKAEQNLKKGPLKISDADIEKFRYGITDLIDDIREPKNNDELSATGARLYEYLAAFYFKTQKKWSGTRKYIPRLLKKYDPEFAKKFINAFNSLFCENDPSKVISLAEELTKPYGGFCFDNYKSDAPKHWKLNDINPVTLETERLKLRYFTKKDANDIYNLLKDGEVSKTTLNIPSPYELRDAKWWIDHHLHQMCLGNQFTFAITDKTDKQLIGAISIVINKRHNRGELGYWIGKKYWGKGYCSEAASKILEHTFNETQLNKVSARYSLINPASGKVMDKIGMKHEGTLIEDVKRDDGISHDMGLYGITKNQYEQSNLK